MQETDKILYKLSTTLQSIDKELEEYSYENASKDYGLSDIYGYIAELKKTEELLNLKEAEINAKEKEIDKLNESFKIKEKNLQVSNKSLKNECE